MTSLNLEVLSLPPIALNFEFPRDYPSSSPPTFSLTSKWMPHSLLSRLAKRLDALWEENQGMEVSLSGRKKTKTGPLCAAVMQALLKIKYSSKSTKIGSKRYKYMLNINLK